MCYRWVFNEWCHIWKSPYFFTDGGQCLYSDVLLLVHNTSEATGYARGQVHHETDREGVRVKMQTTSSNTQQYYAPKRLISYILSNCFILYAFLSCKVGKRSKQIEKRSTRSRPVIQVFFFTTQNNKLTKYRVIFTFDLHVICTLLSVVG